MKRRWSAVAAVAALTLVLSGCAPIVALQPADDANSPDCAAVIVRLPDTVGGLTLRQTDAQSTAAWGEPDQVVLRCGVAVPAASELPCIDKGVFWLRDDSNDTFWRFTTFGRDPAIDVAVDRTIVSGPGVVLEDLENAVSFTPENGLTCTDTDVTVTG
ncbi:hypothetical protein BH09ACT4_BH09ACT4_23120 [soil metagenome]